MAAVKFVPNLAGIAELARTPQMEAAMLVIGEEVAARVREIGPRDDDDDTHYVEMITVAPTSAAAGFGARVSANKFTSWWIEMGTIRTPAFAPLRRACDALGLILTGGGGSDSG